MKHMTLALASELADGTLAAGRADGCQPLAVVVLDAGGHDVVVKREDRCGLLRVDIARGKAWGALGIGVLVRNADGDVIGAVGVSGDTSDRDEACAVAAIGRMGMTADVG